MRHALATLIHVRPGCPRPDRPRPQEPAEPAAPRSPCAPGLPLQRDRSQARGRCGGSGCRGHASGASRSSCGAGRVLLPQVYQEEETVGLQRAFSVVEVDPSLAAAPRPNSGGPWDWPSLPPLPQACHRPCLQESSPAWTLDVAKDPRRRVQSWPPATLPHIPRLL